MPFARKMSRTDECSMFGPVSLEAASEAVAAGYLLQSDADELLAEAEENVALFG